MAKDVVEVVDSHTGTTKVGSLVKWNGVGLYSTLAAARL